MVMFLWLKMRTGFRLLSNAVLPERNPLYELDDRMEEDFKKMLYGSDWDGGSMQLQVGLV